MKHISCLAVLMVVSLMLVGCSQKQNPAAPSLRTEGEPGVEQPYRILEPEPVLAQHDPVDVTEVLDKVKWAHTTHQKIAAVAAAKMGLSTGRVNRITSAAHLPDVYQSGLNNSYNQQWSHAFLLSTSSGIWVWGDADDDFYDNIDQNGGEIESPEGYNGRSAKWYYTNTSLTLYQRQYEGDWYLGYAAHYIQDVCLVLHASDPTVAMLTKHFDYETWIQNNLEAGHNLLSAVTADNSYYVVNDLKAAIRQATYYCSCYWTNTNGKLAWDAYVASGYPTAAGTGNANLVNYTKLMLRDAGRYVKGTIKYTLDKYGQWTHRY